MQVACGLAAAHGVLAIVSPLCGSFLHPYFGLFCHQIPDRALGFGAVKFEVCSRCLGLYIGIVVGRVLMKHGKYAIGRLLQHGSLSVAILSILLKLADLDSGNPARLFYGFCLGIWTFRCCEFVVEKTILALTTGLLILDRRLSCRHGNSVTRSERKRRAQSGITAAAIAAGE